MEGQNWRDVAGGDIQEYGVTFNEMKDMINMSTEVLQSIGRIMPASGLLWTESSGTAGKYHQIWRNGKEILEAVKEQVTGISFDSFEFLLGR